MSLKELLATPEGKAEFDAEVDKITAGLKGKNDELLDEVKAVRQRAQTAETDLSAAREETRQAKREAAEKSGDPDRIREEVEAEYEAKLADADKRAQDSDKRLDRLLIEQGLRDALTAANVAPHMSKAAAALLRSENKIEISGDNAVIEGKPLADFVRDWAEGEEGKSFVAAPDNGGGGASGGGKGGGSSEHNPFDKKAGTWNLTQQALMQRDEPDKAKRLATAAGVDLPDA